MCSCTYTSQPCYGCLVHTLDSARIRIRDLEAKVSDFRHMRTEAWDAHDHAWEQYWKVAAERDAADRIKSERLSQLVEQDREIATLTERVRDLEALL